MVNLLRHLVPACIRLELATLPLPVPDPETPAQAQRRREDEKELVLRELAELFDASGHVVNPSKLVRDLMYRERQASTGIGGGLAIPHVRSLQIRTFTMGLARSREPLSFDAIDGEPVRLFILLGAPPYDDKVFHQAYRAWAEVLSDDATRDGLMTAEDPQEIFNLLRRHWR